MSADNWTTCPKCTKKKMDAVVEVRKLYGTLDVYDYEKRMAKANAEKVAGPGETLREDYCMGIRRDKFEVEYRASCECGFTFSFKHSADLDLK